MKERLSGHVARVGVMRSVDLYNYSRKTLRGKPFEILLPNRRLILSECLLKGTICDGIVWIQLAQDSLL